MKRWIVRLEGEERRRLEQMVGSGKAAAYKVRHANVLLAVDESPGGRHRTDGEVAQTLGMTTRSIEMLRRRFVEEGLEVFVCAMENVLEVYHRPYDPKRPVVCLDEKSRQLVGEICKPIPARPGAVERCDYEYVRNGTANLFMMVEPLQGWRRVNVTTRRAKTDFAEQVRELVDVHHPKAQRITLVMDNLNTHRLASLYEAFEPSEARRLIEKIEPVHTPKHGSWLNMAECELSVLEKQALGDHVPTEADLARRVRLWNDDRNHRTKRIDRQFRTSDARVKLRRLYPKTHLC